MSAGQVPPNDLDAEAAVLSAVIMDPAALDRVSDVLEVPHFYSDANRCIYEAVLAVSASGAPVDIISVASWLRDREKLANIGGTPYLAQIVDATPAVAHVEHHAEIVVQCWRRREMIRFAQLLQAEAYSSDTGDFEEWVQQKEQSLHRLTQHAAKDEGGHIKTVLSSVFQELVDASEGKSKISILSGLRDLDEASGGMYPGELIIVAARPGVGKTALVGQIAINAARDDVGAVFFSLEMPRGQLCTRFLCLEASVDVSKLRTKSLQPEDWQKLTAAAPGLSERPLYVEDKPAINPLELRSRARRLKSKWNSQGVRLGLIVVDYVGLMSGRCLVEKSANREREVAAISTYLKRIAKELMVPVIALAQLNRAVEGRDDKRPGLSDLRESGALEQDADTVVFIYRDDYHNAEKSRDKGVAELIIAKQRNGQTKTVKVSYDGRYTRFANLDDNRYM